MAESEVKLAVLWLGKLLAAEMNYLNTVTSKVGRLKTELNTLAGFLMEACKTRRQDDLVQTTLSDGRDIAYDCQDVIETYILQVAVHGYEEYQGQHCWRLGSIIRCACLIRKAVPVHDIVSQIDDLSARIGTLKTNLVSYGISSRINNETTSSGVQQQLRRFFPHKKEEYDVVVGLENHLEELAETLLNPVDQRVIVICGMGGVGKSTLATKLYHEPRLRDGGYFKAFGWASASQQFHPIGLLRDLLYSLVPEDDVEQKKHINAINDSELHAYLYRIMNQTKCLVVVEGIVSFIQGAIIDDEIGH